VRLCLEAHRAESLLHAVCGSASRHTEPRAFYMLCAALPRGTQSREPATGCVWLCLEAHRANEFQNPRPKAIDICLIRAIMTVSTHSTFTTQRQRRASVESSQSLKSQRLDSTNKPQQRKPSQADAKKYLERLQTSSEMQDASIRLRRRKHTLPQIA